MKRTYTRDGRRLSQKEIHQLEIHRNFVEQITGKHLSDGDIGLRCITCTTNEKIIDNRWFNYYERTGEVFPAYTSDEYRLRKLSS